MMSDLIGLRIKALREERKLSQDDLARLFGFKDRQTVSAIETGERRVSAEELITAVEKLGAPLDYFTNPFLLVGEGRFSWRQSGIGLASRWRRSSAAPGAGSRPIARSRPRSAARSRCCGGRWASRRGTASRTPPRRASASPSSFDLGDVPAARLAEVMEREFGVLVLMVDAFKGVSGAACRLPELDAVLINRHEAGGPAPLRSRTRAVSHPHLGHDAARACRGCRRAEQEPRRAARQQLRVGAC